MTRDTIRVGIVGANPERGWAVRAHVPALHHLPQYELTAVATSRTDSARQAARQFGAAHAFTDHRQLAEHPDVDLVTITVKVPAHAELVQAALEAGKHVYCEWPLALTSEEAKILATTARDAGVLGAVGLQARYAPAIGYARDLIADGYLGRVTSVTVYAARGKGATAEIPDWSAYTYDRASGAGLLEVYGGHTLDTMEYVLGDISDLSAMLSIQRPLHTVAGTDQTIKVTSPDHLLLNATLTSGAVASVHVHDAKMGDPRTRIEIAGTQGDLAIISGAAAGPTGVQLQISPLSLQAIQGAGGLWQNLPVPDRYRAIPNTVPDEARNVAALYVQLFSDIRTGSQSTPGFETGLRLHRLLDTIRLADETGIRQSAQR